eukprot:2440224-Pyramimonas_sp.AAC.2
MTTSYIHDAVAVGAREDGLTRSRRSTLRCPCRARGATVWILRAAVWILRATIWILRAVIWILRVMIWI